jgi:hypothetical protein
MREFANQKALIDYAERNGLVYLWEGMPAFAKRQRRLPPAFVKRQRLSAADQYEIVDVHTSRGVRRAMLFPKAILQAEFEANAPLREAMAIKRERWRARRAEWEKRAAERVATRPQMDPCAGGGDPPPFRRKRSDMKK